MFSDPDPDRIRDEWLQRLSELVRTIESWAQELGWATRQIQVTLSDSQIGNYKAPALLIQEDTIRILLEPIARSAPGADGVVDLYLMPATTILRASIFTKACGTFTTCFRGQGPWPRFAMPTPSR